jgi:hypothetical protein
MLFKIVRFIYSATKTHPELGLEAASGKGEEREGERAARERSERASERRRKARGRAAMERRVFVQRGVSEREK